VQVSLEPSRSLQITVNNLIKRVKRAAFGFTSFRDYRIRSLLYAGKPNWDLLARITPR
jgi:transposase